MLLWLVSGPQFVLLCYLVCWLAWTCLLRGIFLDTWKASAWYGMIVCLCIIGFTTILQDCGWLPRAVVFMF